MANRLHVGDIGTNFDVTVVDEDAVVVDLTDYVTLEYTFLLPDATQITRSGEPLVLVSGEMRYTTVSGDLSQYGLWKLQCMVALTSGSWHTDTVQFKVYPNL